MNVNRDYAGGYGIAAKCGRPDYGHTDGIGVELMPNVFLSYGTGYLRRAGHAVGFLDAQAERMNLLATADRIRAFRPDLVFTCINLPSFEGDITALRVLRTTFPDTRFYVTGTVCRTLFDRISTSGAVDGILPDRADQGIAEVATVLEREGLSGSQGAKNHAQASDPGLVPLETARSDDKVPWPAYDLMPLRRYRASIGNEACQYAPVYASFGCPYPCEYCPYPLGLGKAVRYRDPESVADEVSQLVGDFGVEGLIFRDQTFTLNPRRTEALLDALISRRLDVRWLCETRVDRLTKTLVVKMHRAGCRQVDIGMESGDPRIFEQIGKPGAAFGDLGRSIALLHDHGIFVHAHVIVGLRGETWDSIRNTLGTLHRLRVDYANINLITPYPGTPMYEWAVKEGLVEKHDWADYTGRDPVMRSDRMSIEDLRQAQLFLIEKFDQEAPLPIRVSRSLRFLQMSAHPTRTIARATRRRIQARIRRAPASVPRTSDRGMSPPSSHAER